MSQKYQDIIHLPHHQSPTRSRMSVSDRAAQFAPFAALSGHEATIDETARQTQCRIELTEEQRAAIDAQLRLLNHQLSHMPVVTVTYFLEDNCKPGGAYCLHTGIVAKVDGFTDALIFQDGKQICFRDILSIQGSIFSTFCQDA